LAARSHRQTALAQRFALDARDMEYRLRVGRLIPAHDLRPATAELRQGLDRIRADMARLGQEALGPGNLALGRGYCSLGELEHAREVLMVAWRSGFRTPDVAFALSKVACYTCYSLIEQAETGDLEAPLETALAEPRSEALAYFALGRGQTWEPWELGQSRMHFLAKDYQAAVRCARAAFQQSPWLYEAKVQEAFCLAYLGATRQGEGDFRGARNFYQEASVAAQAAQRVGQSDQYSYISDLEWRLVWVQNPHLAHGERMEHLAAAECLVDQVLILHPDSPRALCLKANVLVRRAAFRAERGLDPEGELRRAERLLDPAADRPDCQRMVALKRRQIEDVRQSVQGLSQPQPARLAATRKVR